MSKTSLSGPLGLAAVKGIGAPPSGDTSHMPRSALPKKPETSNFPEDRSQTRTRGSVSSAIFRGGLASDTSAIHTPLSFPESRRNAMRAPSADQEGEVTEPSGVAIRRGSPAGAPSATGATQSCCAPPRSDTKAIRRPSGDHSGCTFTVPSPDNLLGVPPPEGIIHTSRLPDRFLKKTIQRPSGDTEGWTHVPARAVRRWGGPSGRPPRRGCFQRS